MKRVVFILGLVVVLGIGVHAGRLLWDAGAFRTLTNQNFDGCHQRAQVVGAEDMEWAPSLGLIFVSSDNRPEHGEPTPSGALFAFSPANQDAPREVSPKLPFPFHPHGIGLYEDANLDRIFAINHRPDGDTIEFFDWKKDHLEHVNTLRDPLLIACNDILATGANEFYLSHDHGSDPGFAQEVEHFTRRGRGYLSRFDGKTFRKVDEPLFFANGLTRDPEKKILFLAEMMEKRVRLYDIHDLDHPAYLRSIPMDSAPDNIKLGSDGTLWAGAHPKLLDLKKHSQHHDVPAPTVIVRVKNAEGNAPVAEEVMSDDGHNLSASSVALPLPGRLFLGSIYDRKILECPQP